MTTWGETMAETPEQQIERMTRELTESEAEAAELREIVATFREVAQETARERDEAREAAQYCFENVDMRLARQRWPWLRG